MSSRRDLALLRVLAWAGALTPLGWIAWRILQDDLGANPVESLLHWSGLTALTLLLTTLAISPLRRMTRWNPLIRVRRTLGLFSFFYACVHLLIFFVFELSFNPLFFLEEVAERPYITAGTAAYTILLALAITSTKGWIRRLGKRWRKLHRLVYLAGALGVLHFLWLVKADFKEPLVYAGVFGGLMLFRLPLALGRKAGRPPRSQRPEGGRL